MRSLRDAPAAAGGPQLPAHQPHPAHRADALHGLVQQAAQPAGARGCRSRVWRLFADLDLSDAKKTRFASLHDCFIRELKPGARAGRSRPGGADQPLRRHRRRLRRRCDGHEVFQAKGFPYTLDGPVRRRRSGRAASATAATSTLRLTSSMYHRFHAPHDCRVEQVTYISGDTWNVNPIALKRVERLFCRNERAVIDAAPARRRPPHRAGAGGGDPGGQHPAALPRRAAAPALPRAERDRRATRRFRKGEEMGWFEHGSTIIVFAPQGLRAGRGHRGRARASAWGRR